MKIHGLQKMTLLDFPGRVACTVFLGGCDFRCPFCHNFELIDGTEAPIMDDEELLAFLSKRKGLLDGVAITGGEPCLHQGLRELLPKIRELGFAVKLDTNGYHPEFLRELLAAGFVDYVAMDIKNSPAKYAMTCGMEAGGRDQAPAHGETDPDGLDLAPIRQSIATIMELAPDYEFRTTVVKPLHEEGDFPAIGELIRGAKQYFLQCFTDRDSVPFEGLAPPSAEELKRYAEIMRIYTREVSIRGI
ncbi:MAG: anaerobic ribonucleoside-triphosphate reductase activating protein [Firmicutes bacterium]|nr:anaerobic ribonucleoside-triphosphate reductase activating protein [Bacillota bacterium]